MYQHETGRLNLDRQGNPIPRPEKARLPCEVSANYSPDVRARACAKISPDAGVALNGRNQHALEHYLECRAVGVFPDDPIVRRNARIIREIYDRYEQGQLTSEVIKLMTMR